MLLGLIVLLVIAAGILAITLIWILRPDSDAGNLALPADCPMVFEKTIIGFGSGADELLLQPLATQFDVNGNVLVADTGNGRILVFGPEKELINVIGADEGPGKLWGPYSMAFSADQQRLYVADWALRAILIYSADGRYIETFPAVDQDFDVFGPDGFSPYEVRVWKDQIVAASNDGLYFFDRSGHVVDRWGGDARGSGAGEFAFPDAFTIDEETGTFYVADTLNRRIVALDETGEVLWISGERDVDGEIVSFWQLPRGIAIGSDGNLYVVDTFRAQDKCSGAGHIVVLNPDGELISEFGAAGIAETSLNFPEKLAVAPDGSFALADRENNRVVLFTVATPLPSANDLEQAAYARTYQPPEG
ncbi:MAG: 6-bladed beta-propeller [Acidimicrobiia bacterium]|nr:6-bladed beta-propeller [Acidimicrobiia bacterium]